MQLLQITTGISIDTVGVAAAAGQDSVSLLDLIFKGGFMMIPIFLLSFYAVYIFVERVMTIKKAAKDPSVLIAEVKDLVLAGDIKGAKKACSSNDTPVARMIEKGISRIGSNLKNIEAAIENVGRIEIYRLEKGLSSLATISGSAPMLGFLGTVIGMISAFMAIAQEEGSVSPKLLSSGIYEAMLTTAAGLAVGIIAYIGYNYLVSQVQKIIHSMEGTSIEFIDLLQEPR